jgi:hypothetical protein
MKFRCICGYIITTSGEIPNPDKWLFISDADYDRFAGQVDAEEVYAAFGNAYLCPQSGHIWIFKQGFEHAPVPYAPVERQTE